MIDLKQLLDEWKDDCKISEMHLDETSRQVPILHSKYLENSQLRTDMLVGPPLGKLYSLSVHS